MTFPLFDKVGGEARALELIEATTGKFPTHAARAKWKTLRRLPTRIVVPLWEECLRRGIPVQTSDYVIRADEPAQTEAAE